MYFTKWSPQYFEYPPGTIHSYYNIIDSISCALLYILKRVIIIKHFIKKFKPMDNSSSVMNTHICSLRFANCQHLPRLLSVSLLAHTLFMLSNLWVPDSSPLNTQHVSAKNMDILLYNLNTIITHKKLILIQCGWSTLYYHLTHSNFLNIPNNVLYSCFFFF